MFWGAVVCGNTNAGRALRKETTNIEISAKPRYKF